MAELTLRGRMIQLEPALVEMREHSQRYTRARISTRERRAWHDPRASGPLPPALELFRAYWRLVRREPMPTEERLRCGGALLRWWLVNWHTARVLDELADSFWPGAVSRAERLKAQLFGAAAGHFDGLADNDPATRPP